MGSFGKACLESLSCLLFIVGFVLLGGGLLFHLAEQKHEAPVLAQMHSIFITREFERLQTEIVKDHLSLIQVNQREVAHQFLRYVAARNNMTITFRNYIDMQQWEANVYSKAWTARSWIKSIVKELKEHMQKKQGRKQRKTKKPKILIEEEITNIWVIEAEGKRIPKGDIEKLRDSKPKDHIVIVSSVTDLNKFKMKKLKKLGVFPEINMLQKLSEIVPSGLAQIYSHHYSNKQLFTDPSAFLGPHFLNLNEASKGEKKIMKNICKKGSASLQSGKLIGARLDNFGIVTFNDTAYWGHDIYRLNYMIQNNKKCYDLDPPAEVRELGNRLFNHHNLIESDLPSEKVQEEARICITYRELDEICKKFYEEVKSEEEAQTQSPEEQKVGCESVENTKEQRIGQEDHEEKIGNADNLQESSEQTEQTEQTEQNNQNTVQVDEKLEDNQEESERNQNQENTDDNNNSENEDEDKVLNGSDSQQNEAQGGNTNENELMQQNEQEQKQDQGGEEEQLQFEELSQGQEEQKLQDQNTQQEEQELIIKEEREEIGEGGQEGEGEDEDEGEQQQEQKQEQQQEQKQEQEQEQGQEQEGEDEEEEEEEEEVVEEFEQGVDEEKQQEEEEELEEVVKINVEGNKVQEQKIDEIFYQDEQQNHQQQQTNKDEDIENAQEKKQAENQHDQSDQDKEDESNEQKSQPEAQRVDDGLGEL